MYQAYQSLAAVLFLRVISICLTSHYRFIFPFLPLISTSSSSQVNRTFFNIFLLFIISFSLQRPTLDTHKGGRKKKIMFQMATKSRSIVSQLVRHFSFRVSFSSWVEDETKERHVRTFTTL